MSDIQERRQGLASALQSFVDLCDEAQAVIGATPLQSSGERDFSVLLDTMLPLPVDKGSVHGTNVRQLEALVTGCTKCRLCETRKQVVFGEGSIPARLMVIGEGPGFEEDASGKPFVGKAGKYLDSWLGAINMDRSNAVYIANIVKCRPPENRDPEVDEVQACLPYLKRQIQLVKPQIILLVGSVAARSLLGVSDGVGKLRGRFLRYEDVPVVVTYHPAAVLRNMELKRPVWDDLKKIAAYLDIQLSGRS